MKYECSPEQLQAEIEGIKTAADIAFGGFKLRMAGPVDTLGQGCSVYSFDFHTGLRSVEQLALGDKQLVPAELLKVEGVLDLTAKIHVPGPVCTDRKLVSIATTSGELTIDVDGDPRKGQRLLTVDTTLSTLTVSRKAVRGEAWHEELFDTTITTYPTVPYGGTLTGHIAYMDYDKRGESGPLMPGTNVAAKYAVQATLHATLQSLKDAGQLENVAPYYKTAGSNT